MQLKEIMTPGVEVIAPEATVQEAAEKMRPLPRHAGSPDDESR